MDLSKKGFVKLLKTNDMRSFKEFRDIIDQIAEKFSFSDYQETDRALWIYGQFLKGVWSIPNLSLVRHNKREGSC
jgi:hypothetical protein